MDKQCNCYNCDRSYMDALNRLPILAFKRDLKKHCSTCRNCPTHKLYLYLAEKYPNFNFGTQELKNIPVELRAGICKYLSEKFYIED